MWSIHSKQFNSHNGNETSAHEWIKITGFLNWSFNEIKQACGKLLNPRRSSLGVASGKHRPHTGVLPGAKQHGTFKSRLSHFSPVLKSGRSLTFFFYVSCWQPVEYLHIKVDSHLFSSSFIRFKQFWIPVKCFCCNQGKPIICNCDYYCW